MGSFAILGPRQHGTRFWDAAKHTIAQYNVKSYSVSSQAAKLFRRKKELTLSPQFIWV